MEIIFLVTLSSRPPIIGPPTAIKCETNETRLFESTPEKIYEDMSYNIINFKFSSESPNIPTLLYGKHVLTTYLTSTNHKESSSMQNIIYLLYINKSQSF